MSLAEIEERNYNLDFKNPHVVEEEAGDPEELLREYEELNRQLMATRDRLKQELAQALRGRQ